MDQVVLWTSDSGDIRVTAEGQPSVFDMIRVLGGQKNPREVWNRLIWTHPEVVGKCDNLKFPGPGQRETPVAKTKEDAYYILGLLPGEVGRKYRQQAAKLFIRFLDNPAQLANELIGRLDEQQQKLLEARLNGIRTRHTFTDVLKEYGVVQNGYANCTNAIYIPILGNSARGLKMEIAERTNLPVARINPRDHMTIEQLNDVETAERVAAGQLRKKPVYGNTGVEQVVRKSAEHLSRLLSGDFDVMQSH